jgi:hypothetical protein
MVEERPFLGGKGLGGDTLSAGRSCGVLAANGASYSYCALRAVPVLSTLYALYALR